MIYYFFIFLVGISIGSFLNVVIYRVPNNLSVVKGRSFCPKCKKMIKWYENIPVLSYIFLKGRCSNCKEKISFRYTLVELITGIAYILIYIFYPNFCIEFFLNLLFITLLIPIIFIDYEHKLIFDRFNISILLLGIICLFFTKNLVNDIDFKERIFGALFGGGFLFLVGTIGSKILKKEALGLGDVKLLFACGFYLGFKLIFLALMLGCFILLITQAIKTILKIKREEEIPFGPFLCYGMFISLLFGNELINWYLNLF